jgi:hypothetical protein
MRGTGQQIQAHRIGGKSPPHQVNSFTNPNRGVEEGLVPLFLYLPLSFEEEEDTGGKGRQHPPYFYQQDVSSCYTVINNRG